MSETFFMCYEGQGATKPAADVEQIRSMPGVRVIDDSFSTMVTIVAEDDAAVHEHIQQLRNWTLHPSVPFDLKGPPGLW